MRTEKPKVMTVSGICKYLGISRSSFETKVVSRLTRITPEGKGNKRFFLEEEVKKIKKEGVFADSKFQVVA